MENVNRLDRYLALLEIRKKAYHRNVIIVGSLFALAILHTSGIILFTEWNERSIWLMGILDLLIALGFFTTWVRHEVIISSIELLRNL